MIEIPIELEQHSRLLHCGPRKAYWCLCCDQVYTDLERFLSHGCVVVCWRCSAPVDPGFWAHSDGLCGDCLAGWSLPLTQISATSSVCSACLDQDEVLVHDVNGRCDRCGGTDWVDQ